MQESLAKEYVSLDGMMAEVVMMRGRCARRACGDRGDGDVGPGAPAEGTLRGRCAHAHRPCCDTGRGGVTTGTPVPPAVPGEFVVRLGVGWGGSLHDLADGLAAWELGAESAAAVLLSWLEFVEVEARGFGDLIERLRLLRGAVMTAGCRQGTGGT